MNILANNKEFLKYIEIWNQIKDLFNEKFNKRRLHNKPAYNNEFIRTKQVHSMKTFMVIKTL